MMVWNYFARSDDSTIIARAGIIASEPTIIGNHFLSVHERFEVMLPTVVAHLGSRYGGICNPPANKSRAAPPNVLAHVTVVLVI